MKKPKRLFKRATPFADFHSAVWKVEWFRWDGGEGILGIQGRIEECVGWVRSATPPPGCVHEGGVGFTLEKTGGEPLWAMVVRTERPTVADCLRFFTLVLDPRHQEAAMRHLAGVGITRVGYGPTVIAS